MQKVAVYGGSFDPPHKGHGKIIRRLTEEFDRVIVVPSFVSPFKQGQKQASAADRLCMLRLAISDAFSADPKNTDLPNRIIIDPFETECQPCGKGKYKSKKRTKGKAAVATEQTPDPQIAKNQSKVEILTYEIDKGGVSFTAPTIRHIAGMLGEAKLYFVTGSESVSTLHKWKNIDELKKMVTFYIIPRENFQLKPQEDFDMESARWFVPDYSSSLFKASHAFGCSRQLVSEGVYDYINVHDLYNDYKHLTQGFSVFGMEKPRIIHTFGAVKAGITLAKIHGESVDKTITALILHDIAKNSELRHMQQAGVIPSSLEGVPAPCRHAIWGGDIAQQYYKINDEDILNSIRYHTTGRPNMSRLEKIVAIADYGEEGREFVQCEAVLSVAKENLDKAMAYMLQNIMAYLRSMGREIFDISQKALFFYQDLIYNN